MNRNENQMIIKALNMYGRVPEQYELLEEIERLNNIINKAIEKINDYKIYCEKNKGFTEYTDIEIGAIEPVISKLEDILKEVSE